MAKIDQEFKKLCQEILDNGKEYADERRDVTRLQIPSYTFRHSFEDGFPAITLKDLYWKGIVTELIWFLRGDNDVKYLNDNKVRIWNKDAYNWYVKHYKEKPSSHLTTFPDDDNGMLDFDGWEKIIARGSVGQNYSVQWRNYNGNTDQIQNLIDDMRKNIMGSRLKVNAWNPSEVDQTALPPCHSELQVIGIPLENGKFGFELHWNQRSCDVFLGIPFNIASYGLLAKILEQITGFKALGIEGTLKCVHFYDNQYKIQEGQTVSAVDELLSRDPLEHNECNLSILPPKDILGSSQESLDDTIDNWMSTFEPSDFILEGYSAYPKIPVEMLAPKEV